MKNLDRTGGSENLHHTPGSWEVSTETGDIRIKSDYGTLAYIPDSRIYREMMKANAYLIAAAPELLEAAKVICKQAEHSMYHDQGDVKDEDNDRVISFDHIKKLQQAIAKAEIAQK